MSAIEIHGLTKSYDQTPVLRDLELEVEVGQVYGLLGPNGSGKSTLIHLMLGFLKPERGTIRLFGTNQLDQLNTRIGYIPERLRYHLRYTAREYLRYLGRFNDLSGTDLERRINQELHQAGLTRFGNQPLSTFSKGMLQRLGLAQALLSNPTLLLIDEPTSGLDPDGQRAMVRLLVELRGRGHTIFLATHILDEAEYLCDRVGVLAGGKIAAETDVRYLHAPGRNVQITVGALPPPLALQLEQLSSAVHFTSRGILLKPNSAALQAQVLRMLLDAGIAIIALDSQVRPIEEFYMRAVRGEPWPEGESGNAQVVPEPVALEQVQRLEPQDSASAVRPGISGSGDTLLRELLRREDEK